MRDRQIAKGRDRANDATHRKGEAESAKAIGEACRHRSCKQSHRRRGGEYDPELFGRDAARLEERRQEWRGRSKGEVEHAIEQREAKQRSPKPSGGQGRLPA